MENLVDYLQNNYYRKYARRFMPECELPSDEILAGALQQHPDKLVVVMDGDHILGCAVFLKLNDETYNYLESYDLNRVDVLKLLLNQNGKNFHIILCCADGYDIIRLGIKSLKTLGPDSISWWDPGMTKIHRYNFGRKRRCLSYHSQLPREPQPEQPQL